MPFLFRNFKNYHFLNIFFLNNIFYIKNIYFGYTLAMESFYDWCVLVCTLKYTWTENGYFHVEIHTNYSSTHMQGGPGAYASSAKKILKIWDSMVFFGVYFVQIVSWKIPQKITCFLYKKLIILYKKLIILY